MQTRDRTIPFLSALSLTLACISLLLSLSCSRTGGSGDSVVASVNNEPIKLKDFQRELALRSQQDPSFKMTDSAIDTQLETIIERRLMIQEAMKMGLAKNEKFVRTIQTFWEQTLIRELIDAKNREWEDRMFATDEEIKYYYTLMKRKVTFKVFNGKSHNEAKEALDAARTGSFEGWTTLGPMTLDQAGPSLEKAFPLKEGEGEIFRDDSGYLVVYVVRSEEQDVQPLDVVYNQLKRSIRERKRTNVLEEWLRNIRGKAVITINKDLIESSSDK